MTKPRPAWVQSHLRAESRTVIVKSLLATAAIVGGILLFTHAAMSAPVVTCDQRGCSDWSKPQAQSRRQISQTADANGNAVVSGRPRACYIRIRGRLIAYCGCAVSLKVFGKPVPSLFLASNWYRKFPRTSPAAGMVAARSGHVMMLVSHVGGNNWEVYDPNSGGGLTRQHIKSISGFKIVNPHGAYAEN